MAVQLGFLLGGWPLAGIPAEASVKNAALESLVVHLRLLDDFFGDPRQTAARRPSDHDDVFARHWVATWAPTRFLTEVERSRANAQIAHMTSRRRMRHHWRSPAAVARFCVVANAFFDEVEHQNPRRARAFTQSRQFTEGFLASISASGFVVPRLKRSRRP